MVAWSEYKQIATERGALAWELFVVKSESSGDPERIKQNLPDHLRYQAEQEQAGHLVLAGPVSDGAQSAERGPVSRQNNYSITFGTR